MKNLFLLLFCYCTVITHAQSNRFIYEYEYIPDIGAQNQVKRELMALDINANGSSFRSLNAIKTDSLTYAVMMPTSGNLSLNPNSPAMQNLSSMKKNNLISYRIIKSYPSYDIYFYDMVDMDLYKVKENEDMKWHISSEKERVGAYNTQKATTDFGGRSWTAWFTQDIPIQDGPYKFHGLPGLIVKIEDAEKTHIMTLIAQHHKDKEDLEDSKSKGFRLYRSEIAVDKNQFKKIWKAYLENPSKSIGDSQTKMINNGREVTDTQEMKRSIEKQVREKEKKNSNEIEPNLYK